MYTNGSPKRCLKNRSLLFLSLVVFSTLPLVSSAQGSTGNVLIDTRVAPSVITEIEIGGSVNLYFGGVTWSGGQIELYLSPNGYSSLTVPGDVRYGPTFTVAKLKSATIDGTTYSGYSVGNYWINGTIPLTLGIPGGDYYVKAFDGITSAVAVSDIYLKIKASFEVVPSYGPGQAPLELKGYSLPPNDHANLSYNDGSGWKQIVTLFPANENGLFTYLMSTPDLAQVLPFGPQPEAYSTLTFRLVVNSTGQTLTDTFNEYKRGLKEVSSPDSANVTAPAGRLFGNGTDFLYYGVSVKVRGDLTVSGKWFNSGTVTLLWDGTTLMGTAVADKNGSFKTTVKVPVTLPGLHNVSVRDATVNFVFKVLSVAVLDFTPPNAQAGPDRMVDEDTVVILDGSGSTDNIGIVSYVWSFTDVTPQTLMGINPSYNFTSPGVYVITLNVTDVAGNWDTDELVVTVLDITDPVPIAGPDQIVDEDMPVTLDGSGSTDNVEIASYIWTIEDVIPRTRSGVIVTHRFATPGIYTVTLNVTDTAGNWAADTLVITVLDVTNPIAKAGLDRTVAEEVTVSFDAGNSTDNVAIVTYEWNFGDGANGTGLIVNHTYTHPGSYTVTLTVKDAANNSDSDSITVTVLQDTDRDQIPDVTDEDDDGDQIPDIWETLNGLDPLNPSDAAMDKDGDGLTNLQEYEQGTNPNNYFSPFPIWVLAVALIVIVGVFVLVYLLMMKQRKKGIVEQAPLSEKS